MRRSEKVSESLLLLLAVAAAVFGYGTAGGESSSFEPRTKEEGVIRIVTWNVGGTGQGDGRALDNEYVGAVVETLRALDADLVLLFELRDKDQLGRIAAALGETTATWNTRSGGAGILARRGEFVRQERNRARDPGPLHGLYEDANGHILRVLGLHAAPWSAEERNREIGLATDDLVGSPQPAARVLAGDLNLDLDRHGRNDLFTNDEHLDVETYNYIAEQFLDAGLGSGPTAEPDRRLDYLFVSPALVPLTVGVWRGRRVGDMDHLPLVGDFRWLADE